MTDRLAVVADADGESLSTTVQFLETQRRVPRVLGPEMVIFGGQFPDRGGELIVKEPEPSRNSGISCLFLRLGSVAFFVGFLEKKIQFARSGILVHLLVPILGV